MIIIVSSVVYWESLCRMRGFLLFGIWTLFIQVKQSLRKRLLGSFVFLQLWLFRTHCSLARSTASSFSCFYISRLGLSFSENLCSSKPGLLKYVPLCDTVYVPYCTFHRSFKEKCSLSGAKTQVKYVNPGTFYYVGIGTYCCVFITLLQKRIAAVQNSDNVS